MDKDKSRCFSDDVLAPATLILMGQYVVSDVTGQTPLYHINWDITSIPQKGSSVVFERVEEDPATGVDNAAPTKQQKQHIFYLAHPASAQYQTDTPAYYLTSVSSEMLGNIGLDKSKPRFQKMEFKALLTTGKNWSDNPLFDSNAELLFDVKPKLIGGHYTWYDSNGQLIAYEDGKAGQHKLVITTSMERKRRDALVATWCLRLWHDIAESREAKRESMERLTPPEGLKGYSDMQMAKRIGALSSLGGAGA
ncbi:hypothetical protein F4776DRAFT_662752 [Hypoxylon sp. NC0597]|nr:hypothetical protein F4776DRAFT_662752 [Hypoxylon sp. NC0597]